MPKKSKPKTINIQDQIMSQIADNKITMKPRWYFLLGSVLGILGLVGSSITAIFIFNLFFFLSRPHGPNGIWRLEMILNSFPLWVPVVSVLSVIFALRLLKKYDFSYKKNYLAISIGFIATILLTAFALDYFGLNNIWMKKKPMQRYYQQRMNLQNNDYPKRLNGNGYQKNPLN